MNHDAQFEDRLRRQSLKPIPNEWREDILRQAAHAVEARTVARARPLSVFELLRAQLAMLRWPAPRAWAGLATVWVAIMVLNLSGGPETTTSAMATAIPAAQTQLALRQKQLLLVELAGRNETRAAVQPQAIPPGPRSQRREETSVA